MSSNEEPPALTWREPVAEEAEPWEPADGYVDCGPDQGDRRLTGDDPWHRVVVTADGDDLEADIEHLDGICCPEGCRHLYRCQLDYELSGETGESLADVVEGKPGVYRMHAWTTKHYAYKYGTVEYDTGVNVEPVA